MITHPTPEELLVIKAQYAAKKKAIEDNLPSWEQVETSLDNISNLAEAKTALKKIARVVCLLAGKK
jgi:penicillin V acylase-like amidase (Ntn superfamily)